MTGSLAIDAHRLTRQFGSRKAVDNVSFSLPEGAFLTVFGPNGAGKTTLLRMLATLSRPSAGTLHIEGVDALEQPEDARASIGMISHESMLYPDLTAQENLELFAALYGVANPKERARELLDAVGLKHRRHDRVRTFSRGMTQRVSIARALVHAPRIMLLDEPYAGLDPHAAQVFDSLLEDIRPVCTCVMVSHDFEKGCALASHVLLMAHGKAVQFFETTPEGGFEEFYALYAETVGGGVA